MKEKGQNLIEYALLLAIVVGIGFGLYGSSDSLAAHLQTIYSGAGNLLSQQRGQLEEQKRQQADYENATKMKTALVDAIRNGTIKMPSTSGSYVEVIIKKGDKKTDGAAFNPDSSAVRTYDGFTVNGKSYEGQTDLWKLPGLGAQSVPRTVQQNNNDWYAVRAYNDGSVYYYTGTKEQYQKAPGVVDWVSNADGTRRKM